ncbi:Patched domain-containing protein 3 [Aphelenchoides besseyi]|nr:Patched domain-containing protein 3 [Aphelenchoides besseyi]KAI6200817.1 Patched domain-containing protein 3 [Aphelenchoides besseyi]
MMANQKAGDLGERLKDATAGLFEWYGEFVGRHPGKILIATLLFTVACIPGLAFIQINLDLYKLFVPSDAPVRHEFEGAQVFNHMPPGNLDAEPVVPPEVGAVRVPRSSKATIGSMPKRKHKKAVNAPIHNDILRFYVVHKNYENLLESNILRDLYDYTNEMMNVRMNYGDHEWVFSDFCKKAPEAECDNNLNVWLKHAENLFRSNGSRINPNLQLSYPVMYLFNRPKDIGNIIYGVNVTGQKHEITGARVLTIHWFIAFPVVGNSRDAYFAYREELNKFWDKKTEESNIQFIPHNDKAMDDELRLIIETAVPFAIPATIQMMFFVYFTNLSKDIRKSKPVEAFFGVICVVLGLICTFGLTFYFGLAFNPVSSTMPFLILAVGVDDAFLMLGAWRMTDPRLSVEKRMGIAMGDAGASITVTSLTNFGCFALGYWLSPTPAVADFCTLTAVGMMIDYLFQITFFAAIMVYGGMRESEGGIKMYFRCNRNIDSSGVLVAGNEVVPKKTNSEEMDQSYHEPTIMHRLFKEYYAPFILQPKVKAISFVFFFVYIAVSFYGCVHMKVDISPKKYIRDNSPIQTFVYLADKYIWADNVMPHIHIMKPPDLRDPLGRNRFNELVFRLENTNYSIGRVSTNLWVWEYQSFLNDFPEVQYERDFYKRKYLRQFFSQFDYQQFRQVVRINDSVPDGDPCVAAFTFQTSFYGLDSWDKRQTELFRWRAIINDYPEFDGFLANIFSPFLIDQRKTIAPSSMQSVGSAIAVMAIISLFFLPDRLSVFVMSFSLISISTGVCGFLCLWGSDLDSVSMGCIIMAIGLAVDFSIHICYRYHCSKEPTAELKVIETLSIVGYPIIQAGGSTLWAMTTLPFIPAYLVRVFFQTVVLVNVFGLLHALVWLPQFISSIDPIERIPRRIKHPHND